MHRIGKLALQSGLTGLVILTALLAGCDGSSSGSSSSSSTSATSTTAATSGTVSATLSWAAPTENTNGTSVTDLAGYHIYYGTNENDLTQTVNVPGADATTYVVTGLSPGIYYFSINAYNSLGIDSNLSDVSSATI